jgi:hypothetical protein
MEKSPALDNALVIGVAAITAESDLWSKASQ